jgi:hypothetical protein
MLRKLMDKIRQIVERPPQPVIRRGIHKPCDACGQVSSTLFDGLCDWCHRFYKAHK